MSLGISLEALDIFHFPASRAPEASSIKLTLNGLIGTHTIVSKPRNTANESVKNPSNEYRLQLILSILVQEIFYFQIPH